MTQELITETILEVMKLGSYPEKLIELARLLPKNEEFHTLTLSNLIVQGMAKSRLDLTNSMQSFIMTAMYAGYLLREKEVLSALAQDGSQDVPQVPQVPQKEAPDAR